MKKLVLLLSVSVLVLACTPQAARKGEVTSLRGKVPLDAPSASPAALEFKEGPKMERSFSQQPPLIPHSTEGYDCGREFNACLGCHGQPESGAPGMSRTHYMDREGKVLQEVSSLRFFCTQCHVPQVDAPPLVENTF